MISNMILTDVIAHFTKEGDIRPLRFRFSEKNTGENIVIHVNKVLTSDTNVFSGNLMHVFNCESLSNGIYKIYELRYELKSNTWYLYNK